jgi:hypothetical protein
MTRVVVGRRLRMATLTWFRNACRETRPLTERETERAAVNGDRPTEEEERTSTIHKCKTITCLMSLEEFGELEYVKSTWQHRSPRQESNDYRLQGNAAPRPKAAGWLAGCLQGMMNTEEAEEQQKEKRRRRRRRRRSCRSRVWKRGKKWMI